VVRDCGFFHADECVYNYAYDGDANVVGTMCHCLTPDCNGATLTTSPEAAAMLALTATWLLQRIRDQC
jgi:hypothetical protein